MYGRGTDAASAIGIIATGFVLGPGPAIVVAAAAATVQFIRRRGKPYRAVFDLADFALSAATAAGVFQALNGGDASVALGFAIALIAGVAYKTVNVGLLCIAMSIEEDTPVARIWKERFGWAMTHYLTFGPLAYATTLAYDRMGILGLATFAIPPVLLAFSMRQYLDRTRESVEEVRRVNEQLEASKVRVHRTYLGTIAALSRSIEAKDEYSGGHVERVRVLAVALARTLGYRGDDLEAIEVGALLHDIGKIGVPERILNKPGPLTDEEWEEMKQHPVTSDHILVRDRDAPVRPSDRPLEPRAHRRARATRTGSRARTSRCLRASFSSPTRSTRSRATALTARPGRWRRRWRSSARTSAPSSARTWWPRSSTCGASSRPCSSARIGPRLHAVGA